jgi:hypothetical protein
MTDEYKVWEAMGLKAAETAMEKAMVEIIKEKGIAADVKLNAIKRLLVHQSHITRQYLAAIGEYK